MRKEDGLKAFIVDDDPTARHVLAEDLRACPEFGDVYEFASYDEAALPLLEIRPDAFFLDVEVPGKSGIEFLSTIRDRINFSFKPVFYSAYSAYMLDAIRHSAYDFLLKPYKPEELRTVVSRLVCEHNSATPRMPLAEPQTRRLAVQTVTELLLLGVEQILLFEYIGERRSWQLTLTDRKRHALRRGTSAEDLIALHPSLVRISATCVINLTYLAAIENNTQRCRLVPPFDDIELAATRRYFGRLKERFELL